MLDIIDYGNFKSIGSSKKKKQIVLCHTSREAGEYLASLKFRYNSNYDKIPNYLITNEGRVLRLMSDEKYSNFLPLQSLNSNSIIISLENLGWLEKKQLTNHYINWKGSIYNKEVFEKKWRDYFFWQPYTDIQFEMLLELCLTLTDNLNINKKFVGHNTKIDGIENFEGIVCRSNYDKSYTDLNPSFEFEKFLKKIEI
jgi:N-acetyl-anhydromuramyl-L-alanine amidase AmpD